MVIQSNTTMKIVFRVDASLEMGTGHVMRCLTLADTLNNHGAKCYFICREHSGNLIRTIIQRGYDVEVLPYASFPQGDKSNKHPTKLSHASWLGTTQKQDADLCHSIIENLQPDWLIVDHYALDICWERVLRPYCKKIMVIDDLADRNHNCDLLLDQTFGRSLDDYIPLVPISCETLCGAEYALLRSEFTEWRNYSLKRRETSLLKHLLINLGGVDKDNITTQILIALKQCSFSSDVKIIVVMGETAPFIQEVTLQAKKMPWTTDVLVGVNNMAELMAKSDLAIGAAGSSSWERCCLGLPSIMVVLAENQNKIAKDLHSLGAAISIQQKDIGNKLPFILDQLSTTQLQSMQSKALQVTEGLGAQILLSHIKSGLNTC
ncbi:UDP-2,4-diacetamido-2,4,6-trideoxy-beta-L-altropyranose hydrolase [Acinetobacter faecalis]|uniref:UDP-2,4-diacetamido-2,4, 6-trideoxy-beta-L-altropyranose hydrolase n=1 Tax=Acinetobacter faecalis TaxID=2665161 RepID=UPI002A91FD30|nr:UDP-2,4-diacetamido-2,4,6-trideoxy-beta-L-altropyranose hydrolase [Acinetobacter faecalis]MDY6510372.1 UDP-2,4-diacetamido-2,4,6-trideoxy-beta-L-altropyranose hydrolase [Acinetobacter faecalis]